MGFFLPLWIINRSLSDLTVCKLRTLIVSWWLAAKQLGFFYLAYHEFFLDLDAFWVAPQFSASGYTLLCDNYIVASPEYFNIVRTCAGKECYRRFISSTNALKAWQTVMPFYDLYHFRTNCPESCATLLVFRRRDVEMGANNLHSLSLKNSQCPLRGRAQKIQIALAMNHRLNLPSHL